MASTSISQTQSTFVSSSTPTKYDVFLSFHGEDTRLNFTGHLYNKLHDHGIKTFRDDVELRRGEVISDTLLDAIRNSKTCIAVLSVNYARSSWCLDELAEILNCYKTMQRLVIPVFYKIDPSVVESQTGSFEQAFEEHQVRFAGEMEKVNNWKLTLKEVAGFSGYHVSEDRSEADVINEIVDELLLKINPKTLHVTRYPVGLDSRVNGITTLLSSGTKGVIKFGIYGMGGVGKTTLAKALFNQLVRGGRFKGSCFLANVRENSGTTKGLVSLQLQLINDVLSSTTKVEVQNVDQGIKLIEARICSTKVVVVIDDLDDLKHFQSLVGPFASGSVVIITTRDEEILDKTEVETRHRYMVDTLDDADSLAIFTRHAFGNAEPNDTLMGLSKDILHLAGGLPLALEVFGSHLYTRPEVGWKSYIEKLQRSPDSSIQQRLEISLDALESDDPVLKKMFLDIACFFIGRGKQDVVHIMESCYSYADHLIDVLKKRCLLTINNGCLEMHDLLQDVGKEIVRKSSPDEPEKRSRLWVLEDICDVLKNHNGTEAIECISYRNEECAIDGVTFTTDTFKRMSKLRFLNLQNVNLTGSFEQIFKDLRWLRWDSCSLKCLPSEFCPQKLVFLELPLSNMRTMWELNMASHVFGKLKTLNMSYSENLSTTADFTRVPCLETLNLRGCASLEEVHMSIGSLVSLVSLNLCGCVKLRSLPDSICNLRALKVLIVSQCYSLEALPTAIGNIESLTKLNANGLTVSKLPESIGSLTKLVELDLSYNKKLETLPDTIGNLGSLEILWITECEKLETLPDELWKITSLRELDASRARLLKKLPDIGSSQIALSLQELKLSFSGITALPSGFSQLSNLEKLDLSYCKHLLSIPKLPPSKIVELNLLGDEKLETLPDTICNLRSLEVLIINGCKNLKKLPDELWKITRLRKLDAIGTTQLKKLPDIGSSQIALSLQELKLYRSGITALPSGFSQLSNLQQLDLRCCDHLLSIPKLPPSLKCIDASCSSLERIPNLSNLKHLETLDLGYCSGLTYIQGLEELNSIRELDFTECTGLTYIQGLEELTSITILRLGGDCGRSLQADNHLTKRLFQAYSELSLLTSESTTELTSESTTELTVYAHLLPNESHNFMGIILCFKSPEVLEDANFDYSLKNTTSGFIWSDNSDVPFSESLMVIVPKSIFSVRDADHRIELTADNTVKILGIHLLYNTETEIMIEDVANWLSLGSSSTTINVEEERSYPSKRLKLSERDNWLSL